MRHMCVALVVLLAFLLSVSIEADPLTVYQTARGFRFRVEVVAQKLEAPWALAFAPDGRIFVTERPGRVRVIANDKLVPEPLTGIEDVVAVGEGGLMGMALAPDFAASRQLYLCHTAREEKGGLINRVVRYQEENGALKNRTNILDNIPGAEQNNGCRAAFGPDGKLYITTGDAQQKNLAQKMDSLAGKILRLNPDGSIPSDNPFPQSPVYALGLRNPQGLAWHPLTAVLFTTDQGPSGFDGSPGGDELNVIQPGKNYGWPVVAYSKNRQGFEAPLILMRKVIGPAGDAFYADKRLPEFTNNFFFGALTGKHVHRFVLTPPDYKAVEWHEALVPDVFGRIRDVAAGPDGALYFTTSNRDGRGQPGEQDDQVLRIVPEQ